MYISHILTVILALDGAQSKGWWKQYDESSMEPVKVYFFLYTPVASHRGSIKSGGKLKGLHKAWLVSQDKCT